MKERTGLSLTEKAMHAMVNAAAKVLEEHRQRDRPLAVWQQWQTCVDFHLSTRQLARISASLSNQISSCEILRPF